jgi:adenine C2-methylase RlmN of 23S rRNA A2503 and tRNA A37
MYDYFEYLIDSHINGQFSQCKELFKKLSKDQKREFINYPEHNSETAGYYINLATGGGN